MRQQWHRHPKTLRVGRKPDVPERYPSTYGKLRIQFDFQNQDQFLQKYLGMLVLPAKCDQKQTTHKTYF